MKITDEKNKEIQQKLEAIVKGEKLGEMLILNQNSLAEEKAEKERLGLVEQALLRNVKRLEDNVAALKEEQKSNRADWKLTIQTLNKEKHKAERKKAEVEELFEH